MADNQTNFEKMSVQDALQHLAANPATGLTAADAAQRLAQHGPNALEEKKQSAWLMFGSFFWGPMPWMIEAAAIMAIICKDWVDFIIIMVLLLFNAVLGFWHEHQASNALAALKGALAQEAQALRDGVWQLLGLLPMYDPPRPDSKETISRAEAYGVKVKMVTGDDVAIGRTIAEQLGMGSNIIAAADVFDREVGAGEIPMELARRVETAQGFGRVFPEHKWAIVKAAQQLGHIVGMTGDGVNDAPALKQADVGTAVAGATEAARAAAGLILTAPGLSVIVRGIEEARRTFDRMMGYAYYRIAMTITIMLFIVLVISSFLALLGVVQSFGLLADLHRTWHMHLAELQTAMFMQLVIAGHLLLFSTRSARMFWQPPFPEWKFFWAIIGTQVLAAFMAANGWLMTAISWRLIGCIWLYNLVWLVVIDLVKIGLQRMFDVRAALHTRWQANLHRALDSFHGLHAR